MDNFDTLQKVNPSAATLLEGRPNGASLALRSVYEEFNVPRNVKKTVEQQLVAEMQGALCDGVEGSIRAKDEKTARYVQGGLFLLRSKRTSLKRLQIVAGGLVYLFSYRQPLISCLKQGCGNLSPWKSRLSCGLG